MCALNNCTGFSTIHVGRIHHMLIFNLLLLSAPDHSGWLWNTKCDNNQIVDSKLLILDYRSLMLDYRSCDARLSFTRCSIIVHAMLAIIFSGNPLPKLSVL